MKGSSILLLHYQLKADRPHLRDYSTHGQTPWTDNYSSLLFAALGKASAKYCDVPGSPCLSKTGPVVGPCFSIVGDPTLLAQDNIKVKGLTVQS